HCPHEDRAIADTIEPAPGDRRGHHAGEIDEEDRAEGYGAQVERSTDQVEVDVRERRYDGKENIEPHGIRRQKSAVAEVPEDAGKGSPHRAVPLAARHG